MPSSQQQQQQSQSSYNTSFSTFVSSSFSSSSSSSHGSGNNQSHSKTFTEHGAYNSRDGGRIERTTEETGKPVLHETTDLDPRGHSLGGTSSGGDRLVEDVGEEDRHQQKQHREKH
ncbi:uncharacterized protein PG998_006120 [Apiospora kogelbergensis]|uniref:Uncharacterized protein n=1 Tax=Apiospora kogelbergensis TaxID=1337665 RepID=A0AAW0R4A2_9PEZI